MIWKAALFSARDNEIWIHKDSTDFFFSIWIRSATLSNASMKFWLWVIQQCYFKKKTVIELVQLIWDDRTNSIKKHSNKKVSRKKFNDLLNDAFKQAATFYCHIIFSFIVFLLLLLLFRSRNEIKRKNNIIK